MAELLPQAALPGAPTPEMEAAQVVMRFLGRAGLRLRAKHDGAGAVVKLRPWYYRDGIWWPLRGDGDPSVSVAPVTVDPTVFGGKAEGFFVTGGLSHYVCVLVESGSAGDVEKCFVEPADFAEA